jgi:putative MATE family efflux protein
MENVAKKFRQFIIPSMISSVVLGTFSIIDGIFIGNRIGDIGLAAINYAYPVTAFIQSIGFGLGTAGAIMMSIALGKGEDEKKYISNSYIAFFISILIMIPLFLLLNPTLLSLFGANGDTKEEALTYLNTIVYSTIFHVLAQGLVPIVRNKGYNKIVMCAIIAGLVVNLFLDWLFIYPLNLSLFGAALATNIAQVTTTIICVIALFLKPFRIKFNFDFKICMRILRYSFSPFGVSFATNIVLILINKACSIYANDKAVAAYTATAYITFIVQRLIQGVGDGVQPLLSYAKGENNNNSLRYYLKKSLIMGIVISIISTIVSIVLNKYLGKIFGLSNDALFYFKDAIIIFAISFIGQAITRISMSYFYSQENDLYSLIIVYGEPLLVLSTCFWLPNIFGIKGIWLSIPITHYILSIISLILIIKDKKKNKLNINFNA